MTPSKFVPDDFDEVESAHSMRPSRVACAIANVKLNEFRAKMREEILFEIHKDAVKVYGGRYCLGGEWSFVSHDVGQYTHTALLIDIKEIEKPKPINSNDEVLILGLSINQILRLKHRYEVATGKRAEDME